MSSTDAVLRSLRLDGQVALVTGGAGIYGTAISRGLAEAGARVVVASRDLDACRVVAEALVADGLEAEARALDLTDAVSVDGLRAAIERDHGRIDVLVNNAVGRVGGDPDTVTAETWREVMEVNSTGLYRTCRAFGAWMADRGRGSIVNVASIHGIVAPDFSIYDDLEMTSPVDYAFAKGGMIGLTRYLASFYGPRGVRVNTLSPGGCRTEDQPPAFVERYARRTMLRRMAEPEDITGPALFLASDASRYVTGHNLVVDGGHTVMS